MTGKGNLSIASVGEEEADRVQMKPIVLLAAAIAIFFTASVMLLKS
jgi:hypothetical protein